MMKIFKLILPVILFVMIPVSCTSNNEEVPESQSLKLKTSEVIGYVDNNGAFIAISEELLIKFWKSILKIDTAVPFNSPEIIEDMKSDGTARYYIKCTSVDGVINVATSLRLHSALHFALDEVTCECKSTKCHSNGCDSSITQDETCICSPCFGGDCTKTSTVTSDYSLAFKNL